MNNIPLGNISVKFQCPTRGPTKLVLSNGKTDDSIASCQGCGRQLGRWGDLKRKAVEAAKPVALDAVREGLRRALRG